MKKGLVDLNLLILIDALINERNLIKASKKLQMSSASLRARSRTFFDQTKLVVDPNTSL